MPEHLQARVTYMQAHPAVDLIEGGFATTEEVWVADYYRPATMINLRECVLGPTFFGKHEVFVASVHACPAEHYPRLSRIRTVYSATGNIESILDDSSVFYVILNHPKHGYGSTRRSMQPTFGAWLKQLRQMHDLTPEAAAEQTITLALSPVVSQLPLPPV